MTIQELQNAQKMPICKQRIIECRSSGMNGLGMTRFVMIQGIVGAFLVRIPVAFLMSREVPVSMFHIGLATPCSTVLQMIMCLVCFMAANKKYMPRIKSN